jgi:hypothetical protein
VIRAIDAASEKVYFLSVGFLFSGGVSKPRAESLARLEALLKANNGSRLNRLVNRLTRTLSEAEKHKNHRII